MKKKIGGVLLATGLVLAVGVGCEETSKKVEADIPDRFKVVEYVDTINVEDEQTSMYVVEDTKTGVKYWYGINRHGVTMTPYLEGDER